MANEVRHGGIVILLSFAVAYIFALLPLGDDWARIKPEWVVLVLIYWCIYTPSRVGIFWAWAAGLFLDIIYGVLMGQYALAMVIVAFSSYKIQTRFRLYPLLQQALIIILLVAVLQMIVLWIKGINGFAPQGIWYWIPSLSSALAWPFVALILDRFRHVYGIHE